MTFFMGGNWDQSSIPLSGSRDLGDSLPKVQKLDFFFLDLAGMCWAWTSLQITAMETL